MDTTPSLDELYTRHIKTLAPADRLRLLALLAQDLAASPALGQMGERSLLELEGLGAALWQGVDAQAYVDQLRSEWEERP